VRRHPLAGPAYGLVFWTVFEIGIAPVLGIAEDRRHGAVERLALLTDHMLYGTVVAASPWPHHD
jgi:hypothetical protein